MIPAYRRWLAILAGLAVLLPGVFLMLPKMKAPTGDYWLYAGSHTTAGGLGIYLFSFHPGTGKTEARGLAAGRLWQSNRDALRSSPSRILAQMRASWPDVKAIARGVQEPSFLLAHPSGRYLYSANSVTPGTISAFRVDAASGKLTSLNTARSAGALPVYLNIDAAGRNLLVANYSGTVAVLPIDAQGRLGLAASVVRHQPGPKQTPHPHSIVFSPDQHFAVVADTGLNRIFVYAFDSQHGKLAPHDPSYLELPPGTAPRHVVFHPNGALAYAIGESGSCIVALRWDAVAGALTSLQIVSTLPPDFHGESGGAEVLIDAKGKFLYASNRTLGKSDDTITVFSLDARTGFAKPVQFASSLGRRPSNLRIDPTGQFLFAANVGSSSLVRFHIDQETGSLTPAGSFSIPSPVGLSFLQVK